MLFEPADGIDVQVVGRLVEQQHVGLREQCLRQQHAQLPARRDFAHRSVVQRRIDAGIGEDRTGARFRIIAAVLGELRFELGGAHVVIVGGLGIRIDRVALLHRAPHLDMTLHHHVEHALVLVAELVLVQLAQAQAGLQHDLAGTRLELAAEDFHERRLAAAVGADQAIAIAIGELDGDVFEQRLGAELNGDVGGGEHGVPIEANSSVRRYATDARE